MNWNIAQTLWGLVAGNRNGSQASSRQGDACEPTQSSNQHNNGSHASSRQGDACEVVRKPKAPKKREAGKRPMQERYDALVIEMKKRYGIRVRKWRNSSSGCAWEVRYSTGSVARLIESPYPKGPMSCAIFLHEIGHHAIGFRTYRPRCLEEYHAWKWSLETMRAYGFNVTAAVQKRMDGSLRYAVAKARRRGLRDVPDELVRYVG